MMGIRMRNGSRAAALLILGAAASGVFAGAGQAAGSKGHARSLAAECAKLKLTATPAVDTSSVPETIKSRVMNCSSKSETVTLVQTIAGPFQATSQLARKWKLTLSPGQTVVKTRSFPYACCGSYTVTDKVLSKSGTQLAKAMATFTFA